jgi:hypothetical protein
MTLRRTTQAVARVRALRTYAGRLAAAACAAVLVAGSPVTALAVSTRDLIELSKAGLGDEVLVALIEADGTVFNLDAPRILELRAAGVSERVITAMLRNATRAATAPAPGAPAAADARAAVIPPDVAAEQDGAPYFVIIGEKPPAEAEPPPPTYSLPWFPWGVSPARRVHPAQPTMDRRGFGRFMNDGWVDNTRHHPRD